MRLLDSSRGQTAASPPDGATTTIVFDACRFLDNFGAGASSAYGGNGSSRFVNGLFAGNSDALRTANGLGPNEFVNCTFANNTDGVGVHGNATVFGCVLDGSSTSSSLGGIATATRSLFPGGTGDNIDGLPTFVDAAGGDYRLAAGSLGIDAADHGT